MIRARIGVLVPAGNPTVEPEFYRMAPAGVTIHFARLDSGAGAPGTPEAMEQRDAKLALERGDAPRQGRLRDVQLSGGSGEAAVVDGGDDIFHLAQFDSLSLSDRQ